MIEEVETSAKLHKQFANATEVPNRRRRKMKYFRSASKYQRNTCGGGALQVTCNYFECRGVRVPRRRSEILAELNAPIEKRRQHVRDVSPYWTLNTVPALREK